MVITFIIAINIIVFLLVNSGKLSVDDLGTSYNRTIKNKEYYRIFTSAFTQKEVLHLLCNMYSLYNVGMIIENRLGPISFSIVYLILIVFGNIFSLTIHKKQNDLYISSIGASGVICGLFGIYIMLLIRVLGLGALTSCLPTLFLLGFMTMDKRIDSIGHFTGLIIGIILGMFL